MLQSYLFVYAPIQMDIMSWCSIVGVALYSVCTAWPFRYNTQPYALSMIASTATSIFRYGEFCKVDQI